MGAYDYEGIQIPHTWEELKSIRDELPIYPGATRLRDDQKKYDDFTQSTPREELLNRIKQQLQSERIVLLKNDFPYSRILEYLPYTQHYILWSIEGEVSRKKLREIIEKKFPGKDWISFETNPENKSVPEIWHVHVMINIEDR